MLNTTATAGKYKANLQIVVNTDKKSKKVTVMILSITKILGQYKHIIVRDFI